MARKNQIMQNPGKQRIYKYRSDNLERIADILLNKRIHFSCPFDFNDPFDCTTKMQFPHQNKSVKTREDTRWFYEHLARLYNEEFIEEHKRIFTKALNAFLNSPSYEMGPVRTLIYKEILERTKTMRVFCASKTGHSVAMWAHYASNHTGVVIEFDLETLKTTLKDISFFDVAYKKYFPCLSDYRMAIESKVEGAFHALFFARKSIEWIT